tara:strand:+ start:860 stop:1048 length:189 start_codon:yes stop_codon:yes gene_type:complete
MQYEMWVAENEYGSCHFSDQPSDSDIRNCCEDFLSMGSIDVFCLVLIEISREKVCSIEQEDK